MVICLVACSTAEEDTKTNGDTTPPDSKDTQTNNQSDEGQSDTIGQTLTKEQLENSKPCEYIPQKLEAGMEVLVGMSTPTFNNAIAIACHQAFQEMFPALGLTYTGMDCGSDTAVQIQQIENFITMGTACLYVASGDPATLQDVLTAAEQAGTRCMFYGSQPDYFVSGTCNVDLDKMGYECGAMARAWLDIQYPDAALGSIDAAVFGWYFVNECGRISDGIKLALSEDPRVNIVYSHDDCVGIDAGFTAAEEAMTTSADLKLICSYDMDAAIGAANYFASRPGINIEEYGVFTTNTNSEIEKLLDDSANGIGCFRGSITGTIDPVETPYRVMYEMMFDPDCTFPHDVMEPLTPLSSIGYEIQN